MSQMAFLPSGAYDPVQLQSDLDHMTDVAKAIRADYSFASAESPATNSQSASHILLLTARLEQIEGGLPEVFFRSSGGHVRITGLKCILNLGDPSCKVHALYCSSNSFWPDQPSLRQ